MNLSVSMLTKQSLIMSTKRCACGRPAKSSICYSDSEGSLTVSLSCKDCPKMAVEPHCLSCLSNMANCDRTKGDHTLISQVDGIIYLCMTCSKRCKKAFREKLATTYAEHEIQTGFICNKCKKIDMSMQRCSACKMVRYCSPECQRSDWSTHKPYCLQHRTPESRIINLGQ